MNRFALGILLSIGLTGAAHAAPAKCSGLQKEVMALQQEVVALDKERNKYKARFDTADEARASARAELDNIKLGLASSEDPVKLEAMFQQADADAKQAKIDFNTANAELMEKAPLFNEKADKFNAACSPKK